MGLHRLSIGTLSLRVTVRQAGLGVTVIIDGGVAKHYEPH